MAVAHQRKDSDGMVFMYDYEDCSSITAQKKIYYDYCQNEFLVENSRFGSGSWKKYYCCQTVTEKETLFFVVTVPGHFGINGKTGTRKQRRK